LLSPDELAQFHIVLVRTRNPLNIGAAARAMSNFGFLNLRVVNPYPLAFREARSAVGADAVLKNAQEFKSLADAVADCALVIGTTAARERELQQPIHRLETSAHLIRKRLATQPVALLFGSEKTGLSQDDLSHCHSLLRIPTREQHPAMNLGQAVALCLYELVREPKAPSPEKSLVASAEDSERLTSVALEALGLAEYFTPKTRASTELKLRRMIRRLQIPQDDATTWLGMLRKIVWKLHH
jgi:TrmH family RNA methyltransferase